MATAAVWPSVQRQRSHFASCGEGGGRGRGVTCALFQSDIVSLSLPRKSLPSEMFLAAGLQFFGLIPPPGEMKTGGFFLCFLCSKYPVFLMLTVLSWITPGPSFRSTLFTPCPLLPAAAAKHWFPHWADTSLGLFYLIRTGDFSG